MVTRNKARKAATRNTDAPQPSALPFPDMALFEAQNNLSMIKGLFESICQFIINVDTVEFEHDAAAINALAEKGERECERAMEKIETVRKPRMAELKKAARPAQGEGHA